MRYSVFKENFRIAFQSIKGQLLRTILTGLIIAIGITALVGILTSIDAIKSSLTGQFALLGANTFSIQNRGPSIQIGHRGERPKPFQVLTFLQAREFKDKFKNEPALVSVSYIASGTSEVEFGNKKTDPNTTVWATDENYLQTGGYEIDKGRNLSETEVDHAAPVALIGQGVKSALFPKGSPVGKIISIGGKKYRVVGLVAEKGNSFGFGGDNSVFIPITKARSAFSSSNQSYSINVMALQGDNLEQVISEATATMRIVRRTKPKEETDFYITKSDNLSQKLLENLRYVTLTAVIIAAITMLGAAIALMNIMLVSVTERTQEIGVRKAVGAKANIILGQFLTEAVMICLLGGLGGILFGLAIGNLISMFVGGTFIVPWVWMGMAAGLCLFTGLLSGLYPALKASRLDPIESLRYE